MNVRLQKYKKNRLAGMSAYRAAIQAGYSHAYASHATIRIEKGRSLKDFLTRHGLDDDKITETLKNGLEATKLVSVELRTVIENEEGKDVSKVTKTIEETPDHYARHKYLDTLLELRGDVKRGGSSIAIQNNNSANAVVSMPVVTKGGKPLRFEIGSPDPS